MAKRSRVVLRTLAVICAIAAVGLVVVARPPGGRAAAAPAPGPALATPVLSARRVPRLFANYAAAARLQKDLAATVAGQPACVAVDAGGPIARVNPAMPLAPASNLKLLTAAAALETLGSDYRFSTRVFRDDDAIVVAGGGDPMITTQPAPGRPITPIDALATKIAATGVRPAAILVNDSRYDATRFPADWKSYYPAEGEAGAIGALTLDRGYERPGVAAADPALLFGQRLQAALKAHGIDVPTVQRGEIPKTPQVLTTIDSAPLDAIVEDDLRTSDNYTSEMLTRELGYVRANNGSTATGAQVIVDTLKGLGIPISGLALHDGSGLAPTDRATCAALLATVELGTRPKFAALDNGLPVAGNTGTLAERFRGDALQGKLRAKTGFIDFVTALTGTIDAGPRPWFAFVANGDFSEAAGHDLQDRVARLVAAYPQPVDLHTLIPAP